MSSESNPRAELPTNPDTLKSILAEVQETNGKVDGLEGQMHVMDARLQKTITILGEPERKIAGAFPGDPESVVEATGVCATLNRLAKEGVQRTNASNKRAVVSSATVGLVVALLMEALKAYNGHASAADPPPHITPAVVVSPALNGGGSK